MVSLLQVVLVGQAVGEKTATVHPFDCWLHSNGRVTDLLDPCWQAGRVANVSRMVTRATQVPRYLL